MRHASVLEEGLHSRLYRCERFGFDPVDVFRRQVLREGDHLARARIFLEPEFIDDRELKRGEILDCRGDQSRELPIQKTLFGRGPVHRSLSTVSGIENAFAVSAASCMEHDNPLGLGFYPQTSYN